MYDLVRSISPRVLLLEQLPALGASLLITELFCKFHSFALECAAFLGMWYLFDAALRQLRGVQPPSG